MELYSDEDFRATKRETRRRFGVAWLILAATIGLLALFLTALRSEFLSMLVCPLGACAVYFYFCMKVIPWIHYRRFQSDIRKGRSHELDCRFVSLSEKERLSDGIAVHDFIIALEDVDEDDELGNERLLLWDADKQAPDLEPGAKLHIRAFGNYIIALNAET